MDPQPLCARVVAQVAREIIPLLKDTAGISRLGAVTKDKGGGHTAHEIDNVAEAAIFSYLEASGFEGVAFSEERGLVKLGDAASVLVTDPYCNTTLTFKGIRESAITAYEYTADGEFLAGAIADLQMERIVVVEGGRAMILSLLDDVASVPAHVSGVTSADGAVAVISLLKKNRRQDLPLKLLAELGTVLTVDGGIVAARMAAGEMDAFVDSRFGQPSYEILAYELVRRAGGVVTDPAGVPLDFPSVVRGLLRGELKRHAVVAAATASLHEQLLSLL